MSHIANPKPKPTPIPPITSKNMTNTTYPIGGPPTTPDEANAMADAIEKNKILPTSLNVDDANIDIGIPLIKNPTIKIIQGGKILVQSWRT